MTFTEFKLGIENLKDIETCIRNINNNTEHGEPIEITVGEESSFANDSNYCAVNSYTLKQFLEGEASRVKSILLAESEKFEPMDIFNYFY